MMRTCCQNAVPVSPFRPLCLAAVVCRSVAGGIGRAHPNGSGIFYSAGIRTENASGELYRPIRLTAGSPEPCFGCEVPSLQYPQRQKRVVRINNAAGLLSGGYY